LRRTQRHWFQALGLGAHQASKTALNAVAVAFARELAPQGIKVNAAAPGYTATDLNGHKGHRTVEQAAEVVVRLASLDADGPTAGYFSDEGACLVKRAAQASSADPACRQLTYQAASIEAWIWRRASISELIRLERLPAMAMSAAAAVSSARNTKPAPKKTLPMARVVAIG
jgi:hypothetical protein